MKNILMITSTFPKDSDDPVTARFVLHLAESLSLYHKVYVLSPHSPGAERFQEQPGMEIHRFQYFWPQGAQVLSSGSGMASDIRKSLLALLQVPTFFISQLLSARRIIRTKKIEIINAHWLVPSGLVAAIARRRTEKLIVTVHAADIFLLRRMGSLGRMLGSFIIRRSELLIAVSTFIKESIDALTRQRYNYRIIPMGANKIFFEDSRRLPPEKKTEVLSLLFVGKLTEKKGLIYLLEALRLLKGQGREFILKVCGGGPLEHDLRRFVSQNGLSENVRFFGWVHNQRLPEFYASCDIVAVPSIFDKKGEGEGMPVVILEAMAMGRPVLASRVSGIPDIVKEGINGWLVEPGKSSEIAERLKGIKPAEIQRYGLGALSTAAGFGCQQTASAYEQAFASLAEV